MAEGEYGRAVKEHRRAQGEHEQATSEHEEAQREQMIKTGLSARAKRRGLHQQTITCGSQFGETIYIYTSQ